MMITIRKAFTMIELVLVIVILGIISSIGAEIIANVYESYLIQRAQHRASIKTELAAIQIANRLAYAIPGTVVRKSSLNDPTPTAIDEPGQENDVILQWVGADIDSFKTITAVAVAGAGINPLRPGWSGFCDVDASPLGGNTISTPGSNLPLAQAIIANLGGNINSAAIFYESNNTLQRRTINAIGGTNNDVITLNETVGTISEHYKLAWTSYALEANTQNELWLHYNFTPQRDVAIANHQSQRLLRNVTTFEFRGDGRTIRFKICVNERIASDANITICKEKAVF